MDLARNRGYGSGGWEKARGSDPDGDYHFAESIGDANSAFRGGDFLSEFGDVAPHCAQVRKFNRAQRRYRLVALPYFNIIGVNVLGEEGGNGDAIKLLCIAFPPGRRTHNSFRHAMSDLA